MRLVIRFFMFVLVVPLVCYGQETVDYSPLKKLHGSVAELVARYYPEATSYVFEDQIGFEDSTRIYVAKMLAKMPEGMKRPREIVRGPMKDGVWCNIWLREGNLNSAAAYQRAEGVVERESFREHYFYANDSDKECHLIVTLRFPLDKNKTETKFTHELRDLLSQFGEQLLPKRH